MIDEEMAEEWVKTNLHSTEEDYIKAFKDGYNKSNEWHYPSKGELPKDKSNVVVMYYTRFDIVNDKPCGKIDTCVAIYLGNKWCVDMLGHTDEDYWLNKKGIVYAWKEIILPELPKEIENA